MFLRILVFLLWLPSIAQAVKLPPFYVRQHQYRFRATDSRCLTGKRCTSEIHLEADGQRHDYSLNFVEYRDNGELFNPDQLEAARQQLIDARENNDKVIVFIYIHGWHNNAGERDQGKTPRDCQDHLFIGDVAKFRNCGLQVLAANYPPTTGKQPRVVGIYLAWHGTDFDWVPLNIIPSYPFRRSSARKVGLTGMAQGLRSLFDVIDEHRESYFVLAMGHSFGARALEEADEFNGDKDKYPEAGILRERRKRPEDFTSANGPSRLPVDMVFYVNAATSHYASINSMEEWQEDCKPKGYQPLPPGCGQNPLYLAVSSRADLLTAIVLPIANVVFFSPFTDRYHIIARADTPWMQTHKVPRLIPNPLGDLPKGAFCFAVPSLKKNVYYEVDPKPGRAPSMFWAMNTDHWGASAEEVLHAIPVLRKTINHHWIISSHGDVWNAGVFNLVRAVIETQEQRLSGGSVPCRQQTKGQSPPAATAE